MSYRAPLRLVSALAAGALLASACTDGGSSGAGDGTGPAATNLTSSEIVLTSGLQTVNNCDALLDRVKAEAIERVGPYGFDQGYGIAIPEPAILEDAIAVDEEAADFAADGDDAGRDGIATTAPAFEETETAEAALAEDSAAASSGEGQGFTQTNNQEAGVDEADLVKTDGNRLVVVSGNQLRVIDVTGAVPELVNTIQLPDETWDGQLFLQGDRALLMTTGWTEQPFGALSDAEDTTWYPGGSLARLIEVDLVSGELGRTLELEGAYLSARQIDGSIRIVLTTSANRFAFVYPSNESAEQGALEANRAVIEATTIDHWIPTFRVTEGGQTVAEGPVVDCNRVHFPAEFAGFGSLIVLTADLENGFQLNDALSVFTSAETVYASTSRLAVATPQWPEVDDDGFPIINENYSTALHTFDITDADQARYVASGSVRGHLLNQFSMSEYEGYLRVATTDGSPWGGGEESESFVSVLAEDDGALQTVGQVGGLGRGEQIFAVRFLGDKGYVVTFRQIDPLYTVDLSDPTDPIVAGELKIPGFSSYLHPIGEDHLLGVGTDGDDEGFTAGTVVSLFDISDPSNPIRTDKLSLDVAFEPGYEGDSQSPVAWDARAFNYWDDTAIVPVTWWSWNYEGNGSEENGSAAVLVDVDAGAGLSELGRVSHPGEAECESGYYQEQPIPVEPDGGIGSTGSTDAEASFVDNGDAPSTGALTVIPDGEWCYRWTPEINRSVVIGQNLYTISGNGVQVNAFDGLGLVTWIPFTR